MRVYQFWMKFWPAPDLPGQWIAHCLDFDVVTQGNSLAHAMTMAHEAITLTISDDLNEGRDPAERRAPQEFWTELYEGVGNSTPRPLSSVADDPKFSGTVYANLEIAMHSHDEQALTGVAMTSMTSRNDRPARQAAAAPCDHSRIKYSTSSR